MAAKTKTAYTDVDVPAFIHAFVTSEQKKSDSFRLMELMQQWSGCAPKMWGPTIIGFGSYHYQYTTGHEGDAPLIAFSPRKAQFSLYVTVPENSDGELLEGLGTYTMGKSCIYFKQLKDLNLDVLEQMCKAAIKHHSENGTSSC